MKEFTCIVCGARGFDRSLSENKMYCSKKCRNKHSASLLTQCKYNDAILCERQKCRSCGWNPEVEKRRKEKLGNG